MSESLRFLFMLDENIHFLNHGSFGACPRPVFEVYQAWQRRLERQPVLFLGREMDALDRDVRQSMGVYLNTSSQNLVFIPNATHGVNIVARSLDLKTGDEVLTSDHEYGACDYTWEFNCGKSGAHYIHQPIPIQRICELVQMDPLYPLDSNLYHQMGIAPLPITTDIAVLKTCLYAEYHVEVPLIDWNRNKFVRISVQGYNTQADLEALHAGLQKGLEINA
jgi:selenocysteine lyase/cysteine desulfurase